MPAVMISDASRVKMRLTARLEPIISPKITQMMMIGIMSTKPSTTAASTRSHHCGLVIVRPLWANEAFAVPRFPSSADHPRPVLHDIEPGGEIVQAAPARRQQIGAEQAE